MSIPRGPRPIFLVLALAAASVCCAADPADSALEPTPDIGLGPNFIEGAPFRTRLSPDGAPGTPLRVQGTLRSADTGEPIAGGVLEAFHADAEGNYDMEGFDYRGRIRTDAEGRFEFETIRPAMYGPPPHIHFKIHADGYRTLKTELLFREDLERLGQAGDHPAELVSELVEVTKDGEVYLEASFDVVLAPE